MLRFLISTIYFGICAGAIATYVSGGGGGGSRPSFIQDYPLISFIGLLLLTQSVTLIDFLIKKKRIEYISAVYFGLLIGFLLSFLLLQALLPLLQDSTIRNLVVMLTTLILPYICISMLIQTKDDFRFVIPYVEFSKDIKGGRPIILDSSSLIDGRIADVIETNIFDAELVVPQFILHEVQDIADSTDKLRRTRGRRGLEVLAKLQNNPRIVVRMQEALDVDSKGMSIDQRLIELGKRLGARVMTNDYNLNKVASVQGVDVINLNDVANSLKPRYIPGESMEIKIIKEGESAGQGVGYLDDGTMVVCENAGKLIGETIHIVVTSVLQSSAGRMIFGRQLDD